MIKQDISDYIRGAMCAAIGSCFFNGLVYQKQIENSKEVVSKMKEAEIDTWSISKEEKEIAKQQWRKSIEIAMQGIKDELRAQGRLIG